MDWKEQCLARLGAHLDSRGDLAPPWERFPDYERHTIGWRMGPGEDWLGLWGVFLDQLPPDLDTRLAYLRRHPPAPITWADSVHDVLYPGERADEEEDDELDATKATERRPSLLDQGLVASDVAFTTWLGQQSKLRWPWEYNTTPEDAARYGTRPFWFWSRQVAALRKGSGWTPPIVPKAWQACAHALETGDAGPIDPRKGLTALARMLCAGRVMAPWELGLTPSEFADSYEKNMGYVDAFRAWGMAVFDDAPQLQRYLDATSAPAEWRAWVRDQLPVD